MLVTSNKPTVKMRDWTVFFLRVKPPVQKKIDEY